MDCCCDAGMTDLIVRGACPHDCPDTCAWTVTVRDGRAVEMRGDPDHPFTRGGLCAKVNRFLDDRTYNPSRVLHPLRRVGPKGAGEFEQVSWSEALDDIAARWQGIFSEHGAEALLPFWYMGNQGAVQTMGMPTRLFGALGTSQMLGTVCGATSGAGVEATMGTTVSFDPEDIRHSRYIVLWGTNTIVTNLHLWPFIDEARRAGAKVVCIDPIKTRTAEAADWHLRPRPGTDHALAFGIANVLIDNDLVDADYVRDHTVGYDALRRRAAPWPPERVEAVTGIAAEDVRTLARELATVQPAVIRALVGMEHHSHGGATARTIAALPALTGAWRHRGGGLLHFTMGLLWSSGVVDWAALMRPDTAKPGTPRTVNMIQIGRALTDGAMHPPVKALFVYSANPAVTMPSSALVREGLARDDLFTVVHEQFMTDTARYADYVLPCTTMTEHLEVVPSWGHTYLTLNLPAVEPEGEAVSTSELCRRIARALGLSEPALFESDEQIARAWVGEHWDELCSRGWIKIPLPETPYADGGFATPSGKANLEVPEFVPAAESLAGNTALRDRHPLQLLTAKGSLHFLNSSYAHVDRAVRAEKEPRLDISEADANARGIVDGAFVDVLNDRASVRLRARVGDKVPAGVVSMPSGWAGDRSANLLTRDGIADAGGGGDFHSTLVEVARVDVPEVPDQPGVPKRASTGAVAD
jgi:anaerobic selenocysteine-containing dehydrogenase